MMHMTTEVKQFLGKSDYTDAIRENVGLSSNYGRPIPAVYCQYETLPAFKRENLSRTLPLIPGGVVG